jgi:hypothetical protein
MHVLEMVALIVIVSLIVSLIRHWLDLRTRNEGQRSGSVHDEQKNQIGELEERIKILDPIVTDGNYKLKKLRQQPSPWQTILTGIIDPPKASGARQSPNSAKSS